MKNKIIVSIVTIIVIAFNLTSCQRKKDLINLEVPISIYMGENYNDLTEDDAKAFISTDLIRMKKDCESAEVIDKKIVKWSFTNEQLEKAKKSLQDSINSDANFFMGNTISYNEDYTEAELITSDNMNFEELYATDLLLLQIYDGRDYKEAVVKIKIINSKTGQSQIKEYNYLTIK